KNGINFVATDGSQLAYKKISQQTKVKKEINLIVPLKILKTIQKNIEGVITIQADNIDDPKVISFKQKNSIGEIQLASKLIEGSFPKYKEVIPQDFEINIILPRKVLLDAIKRILVISKSRELSGIVIFDINQNKMIVKSIESEIGKAKEEITLKKEAQKDLVIYFNGKFIETMLSNIKEEEIELHFIDETSPMKVSIPDNQDFLYLLMPIRITATV
ncbi:MAG: DNA polymerase III subunit beta, partial [bacterium]